MPLSDDVTAAISSCDYLVLKEGTEEGVGYALEVRYPHGHTHVLQCADEAGLRETVAEEARAYELCRGLAELALRRVRRREAGLTADALGELTLRARMWCDSLDNRVRSAVYRATYEADSEERRKLTFDLE